MRKNQSHLGEAAKLRNVFRHTMSWCTCISLWLVQMFARFLRPGQGRLSVNTLVLHARIVMSHCRKSGHLLLFSKTGDDQHCLLLSWARKRILTHIPPHTHMRNQLGPEVVSRRASLVIVVVGIELGSRWLLVMCGFRCLRLLRQFC